MIVAEASLLPTAFWQTLVSKHGFSPHLSASAVKLVFSSLPPPRHCGFLFLGFLHVPSVSSVVKGLVSSNPSMAHFSTFGIANKGASINRRMGPPLRDACMTLGRRTYRPGHPIPIPWVTQSGKGSQPQKCKNPASAGFKIFMWHRHSCLCLFLDRRRPRLYKQNTKSILAPFSSPQPGKSTPLPTSDGF